ncbi:hypothetical protein M8J75_010946 [Diaphorina citri]|nr:hypothetical protein M8J75_010946 [Diaphorina citri]
MDTMLAERGKRRHHRNIYSNASISIVYANNNATTISTITYLTIYIDTAVWLLESTDLDPAPSTPTFSRSAGRTIPFFIPYDESHERISSTLTKQRLSPPDVNRGNYANKRFIRKKCSKRMIGSRNTKYSGSISIMHQNIQTLNNKDSLIEVFLSEVLIEHSVEVEMLCMSETRLSETEMKNINLEGFSLMSCYKRDTMEGGGVAIFVRDSLLSDFEELKLKTQPCDLHFEFCAVENKKSNSVFICVYRSNNPRSNLMTFLEKLDMLLGEVHTRNIFLMGDFNINILVLSPVTAEFTGILNSFNLVPLINAHTRVTDSSATCIDNIFTNVCTDTDISRPLNLKSGLSDHHCQLVTIVLSEPPPKIKKFQSRSFTLENKARFSEKLLDENWAEVYNTHGVNNKLDAFYDKILRIFDSCFQFKTNTVKHHYHKKWITTGIKKSCKIKNQLFRLSRTTDDIVFKDYYKRYTKILRNVIREAKIYDNKKKIKDADPNQRSRVTWTVLNQYTGRSKKNNKHISELQVDGQTVSQPEDLANGLNNFLQTVAKSGEDATSQEKPSQFMPNIVSAELFNLRCTSMGEVVKTVKTLKNTKSTGGDHSDDTINIDNLKITMVEETKFLGVTINQSLSWKPHINKLVSRLHSALFAIRSTRFNIDEASALLTYHSLFLSLVTYGIEFWGCDHDLHNILVLQKKALRIIYKLSYRTSCRTIFKSKGLHTVYGLYIFRLLLLIHKKKDDWYPVKDHRYPTRRKRDLITPKLTKHNSFFYEGKCFYNALPSALKLEDMNYFRSKVSDLLLEISPYTKEEYFSFLLTLTL